MVDKIKGLTKKERLAILKYEELLLKRFPRRLKKLILFGSKARDDSRHSSDLDLLVVVSKNGKKMTREIVSLTCEPIAKYMVLISPIIMEEKELKVWSPLMEHVRKDGIILWTSKSKKNILT